jgi:anti-sigma factor RsiW
MNCREAEEFITALADNELSDSERVDIAEHLHSCSVCRVRHQQELALKSELRKAGDAIRAPARLKEKILHDRRIPSAVPSVFAHRFFRPELIAALVVLLLLPALYLMRPTGQPVALTALRTHEKILKGELSVISSGSPEALRGRLSESVGGAFAPMTYDLLSIKRAATAGAVLDWNGRKALVMIYQGDGPSITCYTFPGTEADAPPGAEVLYDPNRKTNFYAYSHNGMNLVFHREGKLICILVSSLPMPELLAIARKS